MKLIDIANKIDKSQQNEDWVDVTEIGEELNIDMSYVEQDRIKCYWVGNWYCTDSYVGYRMYFLDDEPVAFSVQNGRKCSEDFNWFSLEAAAKVREYLLSLMSEEDKLTVTICDINEDIGDTYKIEFNGQILNSDRVSLNNEKVEIAEVIDKHPYGIDTELKVKLSNGEVKHVDIKDLDFGFHLI